MRGEIAETLVALANTNGGRCAIPADVDVRQIAAQCQPPVALGTIVANNSHYDVQVPRSIVLHALPDGRVMSRWGIHNRELSGRDIRQLARLKSLGDFESEAVPGARIDDFDPDLRHQFAPTLNDLDAIGAINDQQQPTVAGVLLLTPTPQRWLPQASVVISRLVGNDRLATSHQLQAALPYLFSSVESHLQSLIPSFPQSAVQEAVSNALIHRDYRLAAPIAIKIYDDRIDIHSPGSPPGIATLDNLAQQSFYRNLRIVSNLQQWGYIRGQRSGLEQMQQTLVAAGYPAPFLALQDNNLILTLRKAKPQPEPPTITLNWQQERAMAYIQEHGSITYRAFCALCANHSPQILRDDLMALVEQGILRKVGAVFIRSQI